MQTVNFPAIDVTTVQVFRVTIRAIRFAGRIIYTPGTPTPGADGIVFFKDRFFGAAENAAISTRLAQLGYLGKNTRRRAWNALADELGVPYSRLMGVNSGGQSLREFY